MKAYKLLKVRKDGSLGSLFIDARARLPVGEWMPAKPHSKRGYAFRPGWHCLAKPEAPHLSKSGRRFWEVEIGEFEVFFRPASQGGKWFLAKWMKLVREVPTGRLGSRA